MPMLLRDQQIWSFLLPLLISLLLWFGLGDAAIASGSAAVLPSEANLQNISPETGTTNHRGIDPNSIPSEKINQFVHACLQVVALIERREGDLQGAETESESLRIQQEIEAEALAIIEKTGLTRQEYLQLLGLANTDPEFGERIALQLQEANS